ncbi:MAG TPA: PEP-CTERM sorting domain-containing protein [Roseiarcus sp.]
MRKALLTTTGLAWLALAGAASAATVTLTPGPQNPQYFASEAAHQNGFTLNGITWSLVSGVAETEKGSLADVYAAPLGMGTDPTTGTTYMAVEGGGTEMATWDTPQTSLAIYWGSIDGTAQNMNSFSVSIDGYTLTGADLVALGASGTGSQTDPNSNQLVTITGLGAFTTATFSSTANAFEFSLPSNIPSTPEPSTWAMMAIGFAGLGYAAFRRSSKGQPLAI